MTQSNEKPKDLSSNGNVRPLRAAQGRLPDPEVNDRPVPRRFTAEYKARIVQEADQIGRVELGALLRREGLYSHQVSDWRKQRDHALQKWMEPQKPGPKAAAPNPLAGEVAQLRRENATLERRLKQAEAIIEVQKKISEILSIPLTPPESNEND
jgi:transposase